MIIGAVLEAYF